MSFFSRSTAQRCGWFFTPFAVVGVLALTGGSEVLEIDEVDDNEAISVHDDERFAIAPERMHATNDAAYGLELERLRGVEAGSPFVSDDRYQQEEPGFSTGGANHATEPPVFRLTSVMSGSGGTVCVINNKVRRLGDRLDDGWVIKAIDSDKRFVVLVNDSGAEITLAQH